MSSVDHDLEDVYQRSKFLQQHRYDDFIHRGIAVFDRSEIITGKIIGKGGFSHVSEVARFQLSPLISAQCAPEQNQLREYYAKTAVDEFTDNDDSPRYCIKHLQERLTKSPKDFQVAASDLAVEAAYMRSLDHPHILSVRGLPIQGLQAWSEGNHDGYFIILDKLQVTLDQKIIEWKNETTNHSDPGWEQKAEYAWQLADALRYLHAHRIIFRDLKPHNVGWNREGKLQLFDFGLCRELPDPEDENEADPQQWCEDDMYEMSGVGTRRYQAPEVVQLGRYNDKADVYGWSLLFWEMLTLQKPFETYSPTEHRRFVCEGGERPKLDLQWPTWIQVVLRLAWEESVGDRLSSSAVCQRLQEQLQKHSHASSKQKTHEVPANDLNLTNHQHIIKGPPTDFPISPTSTMELPNYLISTIASSSIIDSSCELCLLSSGQDTLPCQDFGDENYFDSSGSVGQAMAELHLDEPPPAPRKQPKYLNLPQISINTITIRRNLDESSNMTDDDDDLSIEETEENDDGENTFAEATLREEEDEHPSSPLQNLLFLLPL
jgi:serine/threonine protein kinase